MQVVLIMLNNAIDNFNMKATKKPKIDIIIKNHQVEALYGKNAC